MNTTANGDGWRAWILHALTGLLSFLALLLVTIVVFEFQSLNHKVDRLESIVDARGERIAVLEAHTSQLQTEFERIRDLLELVRRYQQDSIP